MPLLAPISERRVWAEAHPLEASAVFAVVSVGLLLTPFLLLASIAADPAAILVPTIVLGVVMLIAAFVGFRMALRRRFG